MKRNMPKALYTLVEQLYTDGPFNANCTFYAKNVEDAISKAHAWCRYHGFNYNMVDVREPKESELTWTPALWMERF